MNTARHRYALKVAGASGQGINTVGEILAFSLKRAGYHVFAYREYPSLIKGGHATYQIDFSDRPIFSSTIAVDAVIVLNKQRTNWHIPELRQDGLIFHDIENPRINETEAAQLQEKGGNFVFVPALSLAQTVGGNELFTNMVSLGTLWRALGQELAIMYAVVEKMFASKPKLLEIDLKCLELGFNYPYDDAPSFSRRLQRPGELEDQDKLALHISDAATAASRLPVTIGTNGDREAYLITGNEALAFGAVAAGVRIHYSYPMTPSSSILTTLAERAHETGMIVKQVEDEITAAAMAIGSMHVGARALTATSGGGYDLMSEHVSLAGITEIPFVCVLAQRPGPATGLPTWTTQGDLNLALHAGHGEYPRLILSARDARHAYELIQHAFNLAEKYQTPVIVLTDKLIAESIYTVSEFPAALPIVRSLVTDPAELAQLVPADRYRLTDSGISKRWIAGVEAADYNANSDEHDEAGNVTEDAEASAAMIDKRQRKLATALREAPMPLREDNGASSDSKIRLITWGSTWGIVKDCLGSWAEQGLAVELLHFDQLWPLRTEELLPYLAAGNTVVLEGNHEGQFADLITKVTGLRPTYKLLKWDGRPFFIEELTQALAAVTAGQTEVQIGLTAKLSKVGDN